MAKGDGAGSEVYTLTQEFPAVEVYGLTSQTRRCAVSIPSIIAEGYGRHATGDYKRFLQIAAGSLFELQTQVEIACKLGYLSNDRFLGFYALTKEVEKMLVSLIGRIRCGRRQKA